MGKIEVFLAGLRASVFLTSWRYMLAGIRAGLIILLSDADMVEETYSKKQKGRIY